MSNTESLYKLSEITKTIIDKELDFLKLKTGIEDLKILFEAVSRIDSQDLSYDENIFLKSGKAIGPKWAGMCVDDFMRTKRFITGVYKAVKNVLAKKKNTPVCILYAGTGPFATLVMPLITLFKPSELQFILLEVNPNSIKSLKNTIDSFQANEYVKEIHQCDATTFQISNPKEVDIVLIECMQHALLREPQVEISYNLLHQLDENVILIPEEISLHIALINSKKRDKYLKELNNERLLDYYENSEAVFILNKEEILKNSPSNFPKVKTLFSEEKIKQFDTLAITTEIKVFDEEKLTINDSGLTIPLILEVLSDLKIKGIETQYLIGQQPGLETTIIR